MAMQKSVLMRRFLCSPAISRHSKACFSCSSGGEEELEIKAAFEAWAIKLGKSYKTPEEKEKRFKIFRDKVRSIEKHNSTFHDCCKRQLTKFSDRTFDELERYFVVLAVSAHLIATDEEENAVC